jgi:hypothetical protein
MTPASHRAEHVRGSRRNPTNVDGDVGRLDAHFIREGPAIAPVNAHGLDPAAPRRSKRVHQQYARTVEEWAGHCTPRGWPHDYDIA